jgi:hypothetical protein
VWEHAQEDGLFIHSVLNFVDKLLVSLLVTVTLCTGVKIVHHDVSGVYQIF